MELRKITKSRLVDQISEMIYQKIADGELSPGERLPSEMELSEQLCVGRPTIREAMNRLIGIGLITRDSYYMYVSKSPSECVRSGLVPLLLDEWEIRELYEARLLIECDLLTLAINKATPEDIQHLRQINKKMESSQLAVESYWENDVEFHSYIAQLSGNNVMCSVSALLNSMFKRYENNIKELSDVQKMTCLRHEQLIDAISRKDIETAREITKQALESSEQGLYNLKKKK